MCPCKKDKCNCHKHYEPCGCKFEVESFACVRYDGPEIPAIGVQTGDNLEAVLNKITVAIETINDAIATLQNP